MIEYKAKVNVTERNRTKQISNSIHTEFSPINYNNHNRIIGVLKFAAARAKLIGKL